MVVPADLARELYEAAKVYAYGDPMVDGKGKRLDKALRRYEQEVDNA